MSEGVLHAFYCSKEWRQFRDRIIQERSKNGVRCEDCGKFIFQSDQVHIHHTPIELTEQNYKDVTVSLNPENVRMICRDCHDKAHERFCKGARHPYFHRKKKPRAVYLVCGPPCSGKSTYVGQQCASGDLVVDMDRLYAAVSMNDMYDKPDCLKNNVFGIKNLLVNDIRTRKGDWKHAYIIGGYPKRAERELLAQELGAEIVLMEATKPECLKRLEQCGDYRAKHKGAWAGYIEKWFENAT